MRILLVNKYHYIAGGAERYLFSLSKLLSDNGHHVAQFSMHHPKNLPSKWNSYFVSQVNLRRPSQFGTTKTLTRLFYSPEARQKIRQLIQDFQPDIAHYHNIYGHISPSILFELKSQNIPVIQTVHDYHHLHPNVIMFHHGQICEITKSKPYLSSIFHHCLDSSIIYSSPPILAFYLHNITRTYQACTDTFICPSQFMKTKLNDYGFNINKLIHLPNFITPPTSKVIGHKGKYVLYFGRFTEHKGMKYILAAAKSLPNIPFKLVGDGHLKMYLEENKTDNVSIENFADQHQIFTYVNNARFTILPSIWYENQPLSILESFMMKKSVIANDIGGISELVSHNKTGMLVKPHNTKQLIKSINVLWQNPDLSQTMGTNAKKYVNKYHTAKLHYEQLIQVYKNIL